jgi:hypothetical protein
MKPRSRGLVRFESGLVGAAVGAYAFLDDLLLGPLVSGLAAWLPWYVTLGPAAAVLTFVNIACCNWLQRRWQAWIQGHGAKLEAKLEKLRRGRLLKHPVGWITRDSDVWFTVAAGLIGTVIVVAVARLAGSTTVGPRRVLFASLAYSVGFAATYTAVGLGIGDLLRRLI